MDDSARPADVSPPSLFHAVGNVECREGGKFLVRYDTGRYIQVSIPSYEPSLRTVSPVNINRQDKSWWVV